MKKYLMVVFAFVVFFIMKNSVCGYSWKVGDATKVRCGPYVYEGKDSEIKSVFGASSDFGVYFVVELDGNYNYVYKFDSKTSNRDVGKDSNAKSYGIIANVVDTITCPNYIATANKRMSKESNLGEFYQFFKSSYRDKVEQIYKEETNSDDKLYVFKLVGENLEENDDNKLVACTYTPSGSDGKDIVFYYYNDENNSKLMVHYNHPLGHSVFICNEIWNEWNNMYHVSNDKGCPPLQLGHGNDSNLDYICTNASSLNDFSDGETSGNNYESKNNSYPCYYNDYLFDSIENYYQKVKECSPDDEYCSVPYILEANRFIKEANENCINLSKVLNYNDACLLKCLSFPDDLKALKDKYGIKHTSSDCGLSARIIKFIANIFKWVKYIAPVLAIILGILDFIKAISSQSDDEMKKAQGKFVKRLIAAALLFIVPFGIEFILDKFNVAGDNPFCNLI